MPRITLPVAYHRKGGAGRLHSAGEPIPVSEKEAARLKRRYGDKARLVDEAGSAEPAAQPPQGETPAGHASPDAAAAGTQQPTAPVHPAIALIAALEAKEIGYPAFVADARKILGDKMPKARAKESVVAALRAAADG